MTEMKTLTVNGQAYTLADQQARETLGLVETALDGILAIQQTLMGGESQ